MTEAHDDAPTVGHNAGPPPTPGIPKAQPAKNPDDGATATAREIAREIVVRHLDIVKVCGLNVYEGQQAEQIEAMLTRSIAERVAAALRERPPLPPGDERARARAVILYGPCLCTLGPGDPHGKTCDTHRAIEALLRERPPLPPARDDVADGIAVMARRLVNEVTERTPDGQMTKRWIDDLGASCDLFLARSRPDGHAAPKEDGP